MFRFSSDSPDRVFAKTTPADPEVEVVLRKGGPVDPAEFSTVFPAVGLSVERQTYLSPQVRQYVRQNAQHDCC